MSRRAKARAATDKRAVSLALARFMGHGTPLPATEEHDIEDDEQDHDFELPEPDHRVQIGPLDVQPRNSESRA